MKKRILFLGIILFAFLSFSAGQPDFNTIDSVYTNKEIDSLAKNYKMDGARSILIGLEKKDDRGSVVKVFNQMSPEQMATIMKNRLQQGLTVSSLSMLQKRVIVWTMKKINPELYDHKNPASSEETKKMVDEIIPIVSKYFSKEQICLLFADCSLRGIEN